MGLEPAPVALADVCRDAERAFRHVAKQTGLSYAIEIDPALPASFVSDEQRLRQVVRNLLSNAFKFTDQGGVTLSIGRGPASVIAFTVSDTGVGIPADKLKLIFEAFQQADGTTSRKYGGTGLGLSISRELARLLGGDLQVQSELGEGSRFSLQGRKVLVIDDDVRTGFALTAKAMKRDREKAIAAGASDYIAKPVDVDQVVSMMRAWLDPRP